MYLEVRVLNNFPDPDPLPQSNFKDPVIIPAVKNQSRRFGGKSH